MVKISITQLLGILTFFVGTSISLIIYIYKAGVNRITMVEKTQKECPIHKLYSTLEVLKTDIAWIKKSLNKKNG